MQSILSSWAISVTIAVLFSAVVSSLLPDTSIKKYLTVVLGVVVTIFMLSPLFKLFSGADFGQEIKGAVENMSAASEQKADMTQYTDYILKVYMGDE